MEFSNIIKVFAVVGFLLVLWLGLIQIPLMNYLTTHKCRWQWGKMCMSYGHNEPWGTCDNASLLGIYPDDIQPNNPSYKLEVYSCG
jgi:hypothetical protein